MSDTYIEHTRTGYGARLKKSFSGVIIGILLIVGAIYLLWSNEQRSIARQQTLTQAWQEAISVVASEVENKHEGKLIHTTWLAQGDEELQDNEFWVVSSGLKLKRKVEMYQWKENSSSESKDNLWWSETTTTTYTYEKVWSENAINSANFKQPADHQNPNSWDVVWNTIEQKEIRIEDLRLTSPFVSQINNFQNISLDMIDTLSVESGTGVFVSSAQIYYGVNPNSPEIGDIRVRFLEVPEQELSVMWEYNNGNLIVHNMLKGDIALLEYGYHSAENMIEIAQKNNTVFTWILRWVWVFLLYIGANLILAPLVTLAKVIPFISSIIGFGTWFISLIFAIIVWPTVIALAWLYARPLVSISLLSLIAIVVWWIIYMKKQKTPEPNIDVQ